MKKANVFILSLFLFSMSSVAQTNLIKNGDMTGVNISYIGMNLTAPIGTAAIGSGWAGYYGTLKPLNIISTMDNSDHSASENSDHKDVIKLTATGPLLNIQDNPRLVQRIKCTKGIYRLTFWAKSTNAIPAKLAVSVRPTANNVPAYLIENYENNGTNKVFPAHKTFLLSQQWEQYSVDFDLNKTVDSFKLPIEVPLLISDTNGTQFPIICFNLMQAKDVENAEIMIDDVNFSLK